MGRGEYNRPDTDSDMAMKRESEESIIKVQNEDRDRIEGKGQAVGLFGFGGSFPGHRNAFAEWNVNSYDDFVCSTINFERGMRPRMPKDSVKSPTSSTDS